MTVNKNKEVTNPLPIGTLLRGGQYPYTIEEVLGQGSYGLTYKVSAQVPIGNIVKEVSFAVKENFTKKYCSRDFDGVTMKYPKEFSEDVERDLLDFLSEGKRLREICGDSKNIVKVNETWRENGTAYYAMEYIDGGNLCDFVKAKGQLSEKEAIDIICPIIDAVSVIHQYRLLHLDIKPENIMMENLKGGRYQPILIDFGITLHYNQDGEITKTSKDHSIGCSDGYAPLEQYGGVSHFAPEIDVYALGATLFFMLVGRDPNKSTNINSKQIETSLPQNISIQTRKAILHTMKPMAEARTSTAAAFKKELYSASNTSDTNDSYRLTISHNGNGRVLRNNKELKNGSTYQVKNNTQKSVTIIPDEGYQINSVKLNNREVKNQLNGNTLLLYKQEGETNLVVSFINHGTKKIGKKEVALKVSGSGSIANGAVLVRNSSRSFSVNSGSSFTITITPDAGHHVKRLMVNNNNVSSRINNNRYTINAISKDTVIEAIFEKDEEFISPVPKPNNNLKYILIAASVLVFIVVLFRVVDNSHRSTAEPEEVTANVEYVTNYGAIVNSADSLVDYTGSLVDGIPNDDNATIRYSDNDTYGRKQYIGGVENGMRVDDAFATLTYTNGDKYVGSFVNDSFDEGTYTIKKDGSHFKGAFKNDRPYNGKWYSKSGSIISNVVDGIEK